MKNKRPIFFYMIFFMMTSCITYEFNTSLNTASATATTPKNSHVGYYEVSVREWITYMVISGYGKDLEGPAKTGKDEIIFLGENREKIEAMLPDPQVNGWCAYVINSFLRTGKKTSVQYIYNHVTGESLAISLPKSAYDSIEKFHMLDLPVVGITYEQALQFITYKENISNDWNDFKKKPLSNYHYQCFLPTPEQFDSAQTRMDSITGNHKCELFNYKHVVCPDCPRSKKNKDHPILKNEGKEPVYTWSYFPNDYGLMNMKGNVAEMTSVKGIAKGGSCSHTASEAYPGNVQEYTKPEIWLGLRVWYRFYEL